MSDTPDAIRADIERTREELGLDVDALADKVTPSKIVDRQVDKVRGAVGSMRDRVMGAADDASSAAGHLADDAKAKAQGAPLAVGMIAFGLGLLIAGLFPASRREKEIADTVKDSAQPLVDEVTSVAKDVASHLEEPARDAAASVKDRAGEAVDAVTSDAADAVNDVKDQTQHAADRSGGS